ncbi:MAG: hypothetical protein WBD99_05360 [Thermodesulfobacteriota bacterium]
MNILRSHNLKPRIEGLGLWHNCMGDSPVLKAEEIFDIENEGSCIDEFL